MELTDVSLAIAKESDLRRKEMMQTLTDPDTSIGANGTSADQSADHNKVLPVSLCCSRLLVELCRNCDVSCFNDNITCFVHI